MWLCIEFFFFYFNGWYSVRCLAKSFVGTCFLSTGCSSFIYKKANMYIYENQKPNSNTAIYSQAKRFGIFIAFDWRWLAQIIVYCDVNKLKCFRFVGQTIIENSNRNTLQCPLARAKKSNKYYNMYVCVRFFFNSTHFRDFTLPFQSWKPVEGRLTNSFNQIHFRLFSLLLYHFVLFNLMFIFFFI